MQRPAGTQQGFAQHRGSANNVLAGVQHQHQPSAGERLRHALHGSLGADRNLIRTVSGRGYQFTAEIDPLIGSREADPGTAIAAAPPDPDEADRNGGIPRKLPFTNLPEAISELIGRDDVLGEILSLAAAHRLITLTGAGGIGKTRLAVAAARRLLPQFADGVWLAEFSPIVDPGLVPAAVAAAIVPVR